jgi:hypothetical protein
MLEKWQASCRMRYSLPGITQESQSKYFKTTDLSISFPIRVGLMLGWTAPPIADNGREKSAFGAHR